MRWSLKSVGEVDFFGDDGVVVVVIVASVVDVDVVASLRRLCARSAAVSDFAPLSRVHTPFRADTSGLIRSKSIRIALMFIPHSSHARTMPLRFAPLSLRPLASINLATSTMPLMSSNWP